MAALRSATLRRLRQLEDENGGLNRLVADLTLDNRALEVVATRRRLRGSAAELTTMSPRKHRERKGIA